MRESKSQGPAVRYEQPCKEDNDDSTERRGTIVRADQTESGCYRHYRSDKTKGVYSATIAVDFYFDQYNPERRTIVRADNE
jgi:peptide methionine sulfoxide reductase MsrB